jgi:starch-binding outer membrane protein, SusD/RagB family
MRTLIPYLCASLIASALPACDLDVPDLNNPALGDLEDNPTAVGVASACTGLLIGSRRNTAAANGYVVQLGILGREAYNLDQADPRFVKELLEGALNRGSPFGGNFWQFPYANIRLANLVEKAVDKVPDFSAEQKAGILGFANTIEALDLLEVINARDTNGAVIDTDQDIHALGAIVDKPAVFAEIVKMLDGAATSLAMAGMTFAFPLSEGYAGFDKPATFLTFNRAIRARVAAYLKDYTALKTALEASFIDTAPMTMDLKKGVYHAYSTQSGDATNNLINPNIWAHPSLETDAQMNGATVDARFTSKIHKVMKGGAALGLGSNLVFDTYPTPSSPVPIIRNEELILLRAELKWFGTPQDKVGAVEDLNLVRTTSGGLLAVAAATDEQFVTALLYERRYSLLMEGGHRWIDTRRFDRMMDLPIDKPGVSVKNVRYPIPLAECNARPMSEPRCQLGSM